MTLQPMTAVERVFEFDRYINGTLMAEGVTITKQPDLESAMRAAAQLASRGPKGEVPVLVLRQAALTPASEEVEKVAEWIAKRAGEFQFAAGTVNVPEDDPTRLRALDFSVYLSKAAEMLREQGRLIERMKVYRRKLEVDGHWESIGGGPMTRVELPFDQDESMDGIDCRDETIKLQDDRIATLTAELATLRAQAREKERAQAMLDCVSWIDDLYRKATDDASRDAYREASGVILQHYGETKMTDDQIKRMVDRFLSWKLPADFFPDGGITRDLTSKHEPVGTNLFTATQAEAMVRHMLEGIS